MARTTIKATYALDVESVHTLDEMARRWGVSKSEALRRAIRAAGQGPAPGASSTLAALGKLQRSLHLDPAEASRWAKRVGLERRASANRRERSGSTSTRAF
jgi:ribbon-helix-helix CopG family protein